MSTVQRLLQRSFLMAQYINKIKVPSDGIIRHIPGLGHGDYGYNVLVTIQSNNLPRISYFFLENKKKLSITASKFQGIYSFELGFYSSPDALYSFFTENYPLRRVPRKYVGEAVKVYRAHRMLCNDYISLRDEIIDASKGIQCIYLGKLASDMEGLEAMLKRIGFHPEIVNYNMIKTQEGICISTDGICVRDGEE